MGHGGSMSEALRLADALERGDSYESHPCVVYGWVGNDDPTTEAAAELRRLHAENERLREALRWRPIDTAPRDGVRVLVYRDGYAESVAVAWFNSTGGGDACWVPVNGSVWPEATHWMPLPDAP